MSNGMIGMDSSEVRTLANNVRTQASRIGTVVSGVDGLIHQLTAEWQGADAQAFVGWWQSQHRPALLGVEAAVAGLAQSADNRAQQQDNASAAVGGSVGSGGTGSAAAGAAAGVGAVGAVTAAAASASVASGSSAANEAAISWAENQASEGGSGTLFSGPNTNCLAFVTQAFGGSVPNGSTILANLAQHGIQPVSPGNGAYAQDLYNDYKASGVAMNTTLPPPKGAIVFYNYTGYTPGVAPSGSPDLGHVGISAGNGEIVCTQDISGLPGVAEVQAVVPGTNALALSNGEASWCTFEGWCMPPS